MNNGAGPVAPPRPRDEVDGSTLDALDLFLREVSRYPLLSAAEEIELAKRIERGDKAAKDRMINSNLRLVVSIAKRFRAGQLPLLDLVQEGIIGLIRAAEKFDWRRGHKFSTYAVWWIREAIERGLANRARLIRMPVYMVERERKVRHLERALTAELGREPTDEDIAATAKLPLEHVRRAREGLRPVASLDTPIGDHEGLTLGDLLVSPHCEPDEEVQASLDTESLRAAIDKLPERERQIVRLRFGIEGEPNTVEQVVGELGISRDRVRRLEAQALARLATRPELETLRGAA